ncbi:hypothetical protein JMJ35_001279 [Cladonia borealis]|uniref:Small ribosomal subunit protein mS41 n=1 Tax=Cladonia borealis TaxID=184061 RepID=A0AA39R9M7_9LECA|nr:hypothetical protein JMJ35_001279 [Cladonia borealis]
MIVRNPIIHSLQSPNTLFRSITICTRCLHARTSTTPSPIPSPTPFVPDPPTFLTLIGRNLSQHAAKIPNWPSLFSLTSAQLRDLGVEPARTRRYLLWWRDRFRKGMFGVGGDFQYVRDGEARIKVVEVPVLKAEIGDTSTQSGGLVRVKKMVVNTPAKQEEEGEVVGKQQQLEMDKLKPVEGMKVVGARTIVGPFIKAVKGSRGAEAIVRVQEGMWEVRRGVKVDGGERRKLQVRRKRLLEERKTSRK